MSLERPMRIALAASVASIVTTMLVAMRRRRKPQTCHVAILCAVQEEARHVEERLIERLELAPLRVGTRRCRRVRGTIAGLQADVVSVGIGSVDAAAATATLLQAQPLSLVVNLGCSGAHTKTVHVGDVIIGSSVVPTACKMVRRDGTSEHVGLRVNTSSPPIPALKADAAVMSLACRVALRSNIPPWPTTPRLSPTVHVGAVASTDTWSQHLRDIISQHEGLGTLCEEMESFAIARVCSDFGVPWLIIKDVVNNELDEPNDSSHEETGLGESLFLKELGRRAAHVAFDVLTEIGALRLLSSPISFHQRERQTNGRL